ncbi:hypothetical protein LIER_37789 [Lithospermum erythrorhizon]|uniref:BED-type domain-containing protein n=1 Tax=Lithospermum erythrorhizon TaxID=34254 RepID=A0AAV3PS28_LITER
MGSESDFDDDSEMGMAKLEMDSVEVNEEILETTDGDPKRVTSVEVNEGIPETSVKAGGTGSSMVWNHMDPIVLPGEKRKCRHCKKVLSNSSGGTTTHLSRYVVRKECFAVFDMEREIIKSPLSKELEFIENSVIFPPPHNGVCLAKEVHRVTKFYGISDKVASVTVDNASANDVCIDILRKDYNSISNLVLNGKLFHVRCCARIINLLVRDELKENEHVCEIVREGVKYLFGSENRLSSFNEDRLNLQFPANKLLLDNNTRWNSTFVMFNTAYKYRQCFTKYVEDDESFVRLCSTSLQWEQVHEVCEFLEVFLNVTNLISGSNCPTINLFLLELRRINLLINIQLDNKDVKHMQNMTARMTLKYDKYWEECDLLFVFGSILDLRYKKGMIRFAYSSMYPIDHESRIGTVFNSFNVLYEQYAKIYGDEKRKG